MNTEAMEVWHDDKFERKSVKVSFETSLVLNSDVVVIGRNKIVTKFFRIKTPKK